MANTTKSVGKDYDFFGQTAKVSNAITEEQLRYSRQAPPKSIASLAVSPPRAVAKPARSGYEKYKEAGHISNLQVDPALWGASARPSPGTGTSVNQQIGYGATGTQQPGSSTGNSRKMLSLEEVEAQMRAQPKRPASGQRLHAPKSFPNSSSLTPAQSSLSTETIPTQRHVQQPYQTRELQAPSAPQQYTTLQTQQQYTVHAELPAAAPRAPHVPLQSDISLQVGAEIDISQPRQILQNPSRHQSQSSLVPVAQSGRAQMPQQIHSVGPAGIYQQHIITHPQQLMQLSEEERAAFLVEDAKRAKRNHKIYLLSKYNGLMTPQDKNFITRIQLQQLMIVTGTTNEQDPDAALDEDFYYQVHTQIRGGPRQNPNQPLSHFAQTYLFQTGGRHGGAGRRQNRGGDNHIQRMEQQVQRAVEAAKLKPKNKQLVLEGSLGKISFSNAKTPKPLLNIKRNESGDMTNRPQSATRYNSGRVTTQGELSASDRKTILKNIEAVYTTLMKMEDAMRREPPSGTLNSHDASAEDHTQWANRLHDLTEILWNDLKVLEPINPGSSVPHPFIAFLSYGKGKKAIPRVFRLLSTEQRVIMLTMIVLHLDSLDVVRLGQLQPGETQLPAASRESIDLFSMVVTPSLFSYVSEAPLYNVIGLLGLILDRVNVRAVARSRVGLSILTMLTSRATLVREAGGTADAEWVQWSQFYDRLFDTLEPSLMGIFPGSVNTGEDIYVWQFLAAIGSGASPEQQQRLVLAVK